MNIRSALIVTSIFVLFVFAVPFGCDRTPTIHIHAPMRTLLLPPDPALAAYMVPTTTTTTTTSAPTGPVDTVTPYERIEWSRVSVCENGGSWIPQGSAYPDGLGISAMNWYRNGGGSDLSEDAQIMVAERIQLDPPDQDGECRAW